MHCFDDVSLVDEVHPYLKAVVCGLVIRPHLLERFAVVSLTFWQLTLFHRSALYRPGSSMDRSRSLDPLLSSLTVLLVSSNSLSPTC